MSLPKNNEALTKRVEQYLPYVIVLIFVLQPLMDILSYWQSVLGFGNTMTLLLRFGMLVLVALLGFVLSRHKSYYLIAAGACAVLLIGHCAVCWTAGYLDPVGDITNFVRVIQMPLFTFCFISFLRYGKRAYRGFEIGLTVNFWLITVSVLLAVLTGTANPTYQTSGYGILGWFSTSNSQSAVLSLLTPITVVLTFRSRKLVPFILTVAAAFAQLYFLGTRLAFLSMGVTLVGLIITMILLKSFSWKHVAVMAVCFMVCLACIKISPMYKNQNIYNTEMASKQGVASVMMRKAEESSSASDSAKEKWLAGLRIIYEYYTPALCERFGTDTIMAQYHYTSTISELTAVRHKKIVYCELLMKEMPKASYVFGMELERMTYDDFVYDVENDFHGIFFLYGGLGLIMMLAFLAWFLVQIALALIKNFKKYFTVEAAAFGMALCMALVYAYSTAGVLRRPNASYYLSVVLAVVYYLLKIRDYDEIPADALPAEKKGEAEA